MTAVSITPFRFRWSTLHLFQCLTPLNVTMRRVSLVLAASLFCTAYAQCSDTCRYAGDGECDEPTYCMVRAGVPSCTRELAPCRVFRAPSATW